MRATLSLPEQRLPRRDLWLLPLIAAATVLVLLAGAELAARAAWPEQVVNACRVPDATLGVRFLADCHSDTKTAEGPWVANDYNECGYRSATSCTAAATRRIAMIGTSLSEGYMVEYPNTIGARLGVDLTRACGAPVDVQNLGAMGYSGKLLVPRMDEALRMHPAAVVLALFPFDFEGELGDAAPTANAPPARESVQHRLFQKLKSSRTFTVAQHFLFRNPSVYIPLYLRYGDKADFLRPPFSPAWQARMRAFDALLGTLADHAHAAGVPLLFAFVPQEAQVALMAGRAAPPGVDPNALPAALSAIAQRHGVLFADTSLALRREPAPERLYYQVDGHLSGQGQPIAAAAIARRLANVPGPFAACHATLSSSAAE